MPSKYQKAWIKSCSSLTIGNRLEPCWYEDRVGSVILVREVDWPSAFVEAKNGASVLRRDLEFLKKQ